MPEYNVPPSCQFDHSSYPPSFWLHAFYCVRVIWLRRWKCSKFPHWRTMCRLKTNSKLIHGSSVIILVLSYLIDRLECPLIMSQDLTPIGRLEGRRRTFLEREAERTLNTPATGLYALNWARFDPNWPARRPAADRFRARGRAFTKHFLSKIEWFFSGIWLNISGHRPPIGPWLVPILNLSLCFKMSEVGPRLPGLKAGGGPF